ncbi:MAG: D-glycero-beta-D-manno-heptose-7-phosphate kinase [Ignavibacteria bacterium]|nr:D-glycero-beta-D-manno-heptose-7-phosphate kinase [Ignavibacteria bacterium]MBP6509897.1 D-glycero-beta-D-manno-heptose-7-phosphate kinase [Candidatus Kapabacteria bacterium]MBK6761549.1 D-glycero-beta-D-manno-heptose-7-phosphate kinase [Ignavibacteria bacterium]MBK7033574.1 D-glycero-beta-D-manno-heptose-7-phosphate kinase [Ignavibacteria bacterium]MBK7186208.1 D-glycero-beta-D-manno-heptose-7-phosphate kinase [Ignavibacteria bacterium]
MHHLSRERTQNLLTALRGMEIAVVGDIMLDRYFWGSVHRVSPEAPVPVVDIDNESFHLGGAANVATNLLGLGAQPLLCGVVGDDSSGKMLREIGLAAGLDVDGIAVEEGRPTTVKTRVIGNNQQIVRLDRETRAHVAPNVIESVSDFLRKRTSLRGIILEDYDKGFLSPQLIASVMAVASERSIPVFVDPKRRHFFDFTSCTLFKPNRKEAADALDIPLKTDADVREAGAMLLEKLDCDNVLITLGSEGMMLFERSGDVSSVPTRAKNVADVSGAGDTVIATLGAMVAAGASMREAAALANVAAGCVVAEPGIIAITADSLLSAVHEDETSTRPS